MSCSKRNLPSSGADTAGLSRRAGGRVSSYGDARGPQGDRGGRWGLRRDADGRPAAILEIDTTSRPQARRAGDGGGASIRRSIVDTMQESLVVLDPQLRIISANPRSTRPSGPRRRRSLVAAAGPGVHCGPTRIVPPARRRCDTRRQLRGFGIECNGGESRAFVLSARPIRPPANGAQRSCW